MNMKMKGMVITAVAMSTGWNELGSKSTPASLRNGKGNTVKIQNATIMARITLFRLSSAGTLSFVIFFL